jgi:hypothetical protein
VELLIHCPSVYSVILNFIGKGTNSSYVLKLVQFVKSCWDRGLNQNFERFLQQAKAFEELTSSELLKRSIRQQCGTWEAVPKLIASICPHEIIVHHVTKRVNLSQLEYLNTAKILLLYRNSPVKWQRSLPSRLGDRHLVAVFSNGEYVFRWTEKLKFWKVICQKSHIQLRNY